MTIAKQLWAGEFQGHPKTQIANPILKVLLSLGPMTAGAWLGSQGADDLTAAELLLCVRVAVVGWLCLHLDFRPNRFSGTLSRLVVIVVFLAFLVWRDVAILRDITRTVANLPLLRLLTTDLGAKVSVVLLCYVVGALGIRSLSSRDVLWYGRKLGFPGMYGLYITIATTFFCVQNGLGSRLALAWSVASTKCYLARRSIAISRSSAIIRFVRIFVVALVHQFKELERNAESLLYERGYFRKTYGDPRYFLALKNEDKAAIVILILSTSFIVMMP